MSYEERNAWASLIASLFAWGIIGTQIIGDLRAGVFDGPEGLQLWAWAVVKLMLWGIGILIVVTVAMAIFDAILRGKDVPATQADERDQLIALLSHRIVLVAVSTGVIGAIIALAWGIGAPLALTGIFVACALGDTLGTFYRIWRYRRGF